MPDIYFILFEGIIYLQFALCFLHARKLGRENLLRLAAGVLFGLMLELATIRQLDAYEYGEFIIMVLDVPLCIGVAWSCILYSGMEFTDASSLPYWMRPVLDGLLALNIDLALDAIAIRLGFWDWGQGLEFQYAGVPYANFWAWFWVIFFFSFGYRLLARRADWIGVWLSPLLAIIVGLAGVLATNALMANVIPFAYHAVVVAIVLIAALLAVLALRPRFYLYPLPALVFWVPALTHFYTLLAGIFSGAIFRPPFLLVISLAMIVIALYLHRPILQPIFSSSEA
jgi:hypothetical protein